MIDAKKFYILETINDKLFRFLCPWSNCFNPEIQSKYISGLLNYLEISKDSSTNKLMDRVYLYQKIHGKSLNNMFYKIKPDIEIIQKQSQIDIDSNEMRNMSLINIMKLIRKKVGVKNENSEKIIDIIINDQQIVDEFINVIIHLFNSYYGKLKYLNNSEVYCIFLYEINLLRNLFIKQLYDYYNEIKKNKKNEIINLSSNIQIINYLENIIKEVINSIILIDSNIYYNIFIKAKLMLL